MMMLLKKQMGTIALWRILNPVRQTLLYSEMFPTQVSAIRKFCAWIRNEIRRTLCTKDNLVMS